MRESTLPKTYSPSEVETKWYNTWKKGGYFKPRKGKQNETYTICIPLPNVTGILHSGHALDITTQDAIIRYKRMKGFETLYVPGLDHAGIATQAVVEKQVFEEEGKTKHDFSREEFLEKIWKWKDEKGDKILKQQETMGASPDWDYLLFSMDDESNEAVRKAFTDLYNEGLIYQANYIINWDPILQSAISDAEVEHKDVKGAFYHIHYNVKETGQKLEIATTRPETMFGDTAVAVNPNDERFKDLIGKHAIIPICNREVPIIGDEHVDIEMGTGCLKVTPGHDFNDFEIGKRHKLDTILILNKDGTLNKEALEFEGLPCKKARKKVATKLDELGLLVEVKDHTHSVGHGDRSKAIVEPMVSKQWFLNTKDMSKTALDAVKSDDTRFYAKSWENTYFSWLKEPRDWCISRQQWWGHQIPVFYCDDCNHNFATEEKKPSTCPKCNSTKLTQDPDVLDTWFSSGLWPMSTLGWPNKERMAEKGFDRFYPNATLVTGYDIIFFWVARMMMMGTKFTNTVPFKKVYIHAIVRDKDGKKMSKSLGNGIDPLEMVAQYGADAFRYTLASGSGYNRNINLDPERIGGFRNFINKIWNAFRFIHPSLELANNEIDLKNLDHHERWIISELNATIKNVSESMEEFRFDDSCQSIYSFIYDKFCSWFIELSKPVLNKEGSEEAIRRASVLKHCFRKVVAILHPLSPFLTEELWQQLKSDQEDLLIVSDYPEHDESLTFTQDQDSMNKFIEIITSIRNLRKSVNISPKDLLPIELFLDDQSLVEYFEKETVSLKEIGRLKSISISSKSKDRPTKSIMKATTHTEVFLPLDGVIDLAAQIARLEKDLAKTQKEFDKYDKKLNNERFMNNAPDEVVVEVKEKAQEFKTKLSAISENIKMFKA